VAGGRAGVGVDHIRRNGSLSQQLRHQAQRNNGLGFG
jgi:hypothetical protein